jgi:hypothetical protein
MRPRTAVSTVLLIAVQVGKLYNNQYCTHYEMHRTCTHTCGLAADGESRCIIWTFQRSRAWMAFELSYIFMVQSNAHIQDPNRHHMKGRHSLCCCQYAWANYIRRPVILGGPSIALYQTEERRVVFTIVPVLISVSLESPLGDTSRRHTLSIDQVKTKFCRVNTYPTYGASMTVAD